MRKRSLTIFAETSTGKSTALQPSTAPARGQRTTKLTSLVPALFLYNCHHRCKRRLPQRRRRRNDDGPLSISNYNSNRKRSLRRVCGQNEDDSTRPDTTNPSKRKYICVSRIYGPLSIAHQPYRSQRDSAASKQILPVRERRAWIRNQAASVTKQRCTQ